MQSPANGIPSPGQRQTQKCLSLLLTIRTKPQQPRHPDDERDLFGREEALRMNEEIMDFQWFEHVTWDSIKDLRSTTYVQPSTRFKFALQQPQHAILRVIIPNNPHWHQNQPGKRLCSAAGSFWDDLQSMLLRATVHTSWMRDWNSFGLRTGLHSGPWYVPNVMLLRRRTRRAERTSSRSSHVFAKLLH